MDVSQVCALCNKPNDQMLMLACIHDPCINCAATAFADQVHIKGQSSQKYICQICGQETMLDASTIAELNNLAKNVIKSPSKAPKSPSLPKNKGVGPVSTMTTANTNPKKKETSSSPKKVIYYCKDHSEQEISYYCFTCWANICPECAIHGAHKDHQVKLIKKAISQVKGQYMEIVSKIGSSQNTMTKYKDGYLRLIKQANDRHARQKILVSRQFQLLRNLLIVKQKELLKQLDEINKQNIQILTGALEGINQNHQQVIKVKKSIQLTLKKDDVLVLEDFKKISQPDQKVQLLTKTSQTVTGDTSLLNTEFLQQQIKQIMESINNLKVNLKNNKQLKQQILNIFHNLIIHDKLMIQNLLIIQYLIQYINLLHNAIIIKMNINVSYPSQKIIRILFDKINLLAHIKLKNQSLVNTFEEKIKKNQPIKDILSISIELIEQIYNKQLAIIDNNSLMLTQPIQHITLQEYQNLQNLLQKVELKNRELIRNKQQLKLYCDQIQTKLKNTQQSNDQLLKSTRQMLITLKRQNQSLIQQVAKYKNQSKQISLRQQRIITNQVFKIDSQENSFRDSKKLKSINDKSIKGIYSREKAN